MGAITDFFNEVELRVINTVEDILVDAVAESAKQIQKDYQNRVINKIIDCYYDEYTPKRYKRTGDLYNLINVRISASGTKIIGQIERDPDNLAQHFSRSPRHQSGGSWVSRFDYEFDPDGSNNGLPENKWIYQNFIKGIHPIYTFHDGELENRSVYTSTYYSNYKKYHQQYGPRAAAIVVSNIKKQCAKYFK